MDFLHPGKSIHTSRRISDSLSGRWNCFSFSLRIGKGGLSRVFMVWTLLLCVFGLKAQEISVVKFEGHDTFNVKAGTEQTIRLTFRIDEKYHIQGAEIKDEYLIPTRLTFTDTSGISIGTVTFPPTKKFWMNGVDEPLEVFDHLLEVDIIVQAARAGKKKQYPVKGNLYYQACDSFKCYYPRSLDFQILLDVR